jgi:MFS superfamily sulfate permease-like transporter
VVFQFGADLFYANATSFAADVRALVEADGPPVQWFVIDAGAITQIDYSAARVVEDLHRDLVHHGVTLVLVHADASLRADLQRHRLTDVIGADHVFDTLHQALAAIAKHP